MEAAKPLSKLQSYSFHFLAIASQNVVSMHFHQRPHAALCIALRPEKKDLKVMNTKKGSSSPNSHHQSTKNPPLLDSVNRLKMRQALRGHPRNSWQKHISLQHCISESDHTNSND
ncbi:hypothetical protein DH2020_032295 [Rehmannia glutinosa]|uniref:Uncharacterized protein n=1 Tax=Rehmannia glutinosa TaxID=99300 RepID=A0ABR0VIX3_REHGL